MVKKRLLIIDSDRQLNKINEKVLHSSGLVSELHFTFNGADALDYLITRLEKGYSLPQVIVFDFDLPRMGGLEFVDQFQLLEIPGKSAIELVAFSYFCNPRYKEKAIAKGVSHFLDKPYILRGLTSIVMNCKGML